MAAFARDVAKTSSEMHAADAAHEPACPSATAVTAGVNGGLTAA